jgi:hypothetical protein
MAEAEAIPAGAPELWITRDHDVSADFTLVPVSTCNGDHDLEAVAFDAVGTTDN